MDYQSIAFERSFGTSAQIPPSTVPEIAFVGRSNVGKSSLLNKLFNRKGLAKVSQTPGKTTTVNFFATRDARFVDLPGYGYAQVSKGERERWQELIEGYFNQERDIALVCSLIDIRHAATALDETMVAFLQEAEFPYALVLTKGDKLSHSKCQAQKRAICKQLHVSGDVPVIVTSSQSGTGIDELRDLISNRLSNANTVE